MCRFGLGHPSWLECVDTHTRPARDALNLRFEFWDVDVVVDIDRSRREGAEYGTVPALQ